MAIRKKGSRNISVAGHDFKWRATGNDGWISIVLWPVSNEDSRVVAQLDYHHETKQVEFGTSPLSQQVVTNRMIRKLILHIGIEKIIRNHGQINVEDVEEIYKPEGE